MTEISFADLEVETRMLEMTSFLTEPRSDPVDSAEQLDRFLSQACLHFQFISKVDTDWHTRMFEGGEEFDPAVEERIRGYYRRWSELARPGESLLTLIESAGLVVPGSAQFRADLRESLAIAADQGDFFDRPELIARQEEAIEANRRGETVDFEEMGH